MQSSISTVSPLRQRMVEDMRMRKLAPKTQSAYIRAVRKFTKFLGHTPDTATDEDLRRFQLDMVDKGASPITLNATIVGLNPCSRLPWAALRLWPRCSRCACRRSCPWF